MESLILYPSDRILKDRDKVYIQSCDHCKDGLALDFNYNDTNLEIIRKVPKTDPSHHHVSVEDENVAYLNEISIAYPISPKYFVFRLFERVRKISEQDLLTKFATGKVPECVLHHLAKLCTQDQTGHWVANDNIDIQYDDFKEQIRPAFFDREQLDQFLKINCCKCQRNTGRSPTLNEYFEKKKAKK